MKCLSDRPMFVKRISHLVWNLLYSCFQNIRFFASFANFQDLVFDIGGIISPLSITFEGLFTIQFNRNNEEKKIGVKPLSPINGLKVMAITTER